MYDTEQARDEALTAIEAMNQALRTNADTVEHRYLERLMLDRDEMLAHAHFTLAVPILELSARARICWTDLYDIVDAVKARKLQEHRAAFWPHGAAEPDVRSAEQSPDTAPAEDGEQS